MTGLILYPLGAVLALLLSAWAWERAAPGEDAPNARQRHAIFFGCVVGAALGAKLGFVFAEGLGGSVRALLQGKTVTGALLGAYAGVELAKSHVGYHTPTGDRFALLAPLSLSIGRVGCWAQGCCLGLPLPAAAWTLTDAHGIARWPAVPLELGFNLAFLAWVAVILQRRGERRSRLWGQLFHVYLMAYGAFRFAHEFLRETPRWFGSISGYHVLSLLIFALGAVGFARRDRLVEYTPLRAN
ncbi:MAG TPA: prolipoprotein diacylglyceryl transferase family protein [Polyangiales bacterium]|nr:prolipoprotein diacylglyceryl transferase family protein [Polyangiales bacterium]